MTDHDRYNSQMRHITAYVGIMGCLCLSGCAATSSEISVTRFHNFGPDNVVMPKGIHDAGDREDHINIKQNLFFGTINVQQARGDSVTEHGKKTDMLEQSVYRSAIGRELQRIGYSLIKEGQGAYSAEYILRTSRFIATGPKGTSVSIGAGTGGRSTVFGGGLTFGLGSKNKNMIRYQLDVHIVNNAADKHIWEGKAEWIAQAKGPSAQPALAIDKLSKALFENYPGPSGKTVRVK